MTSDGMRLQEIYLETPPEDIAYIKFIFESYEEVGIIRTIDRKKSIIVLLAMDDFAETAREILNSLKREVPVREVPRPVDSSADWFMTELATEAAGKQPA
jgi:hypothetical protein